jgi:tRNA pseudouridine55 synthase
VDGVIVVDKPEGWTSHDAVARVRRLADTRRVGHLGTLDPIATGVLPLVIGRATRLSQFYARSEKVYEGTIRFGLSTDTYDRQGSPTSPETEPVIDAGQLDRALDAFRGTFMQKPPPVSAKKIAGVPAYKMARQQAEAELKLVEVTVEEARVLGVEGRDARVLVRCSAGTYLRSIAHELGTIFGCGAHLLDLRRTRSGEFTIDQARAIPELEDLAAEGRLEEALVPAAALLPEFPAEYVDDLAERQIRQGRDFAVSPFRVRRGAQYVKAVNRAGELVAIGEIRLPNLYHPFVVL